MPGFSPNKKCATLSAWLRHYGKISEQMKCKCSHDSYSIFDRQHISDVAPQSALWV
jgi:hypothetical protein